MRVDPRQMTLDLFPQEHVKAESPMESCVSWLTGERGCDEGRVRPLVAECYRLFRVPEAFDRARALEYFYGDRAVPRLRACPPSLIGVFDAGTDCHTVWDRCWAARWVPLREAMEVREWRYNYRMPYTGAPVFIWYIDNEGREVKRPYGEEMECEG